MTRSATLGATALAALALAACGGGDEGGTATVEPPKPADSLAELAKRTQTALTTENCPGLDQVNVKDEAAITLGCPTTDDKAAEAYEGFTVKGGAEYGSGAVVDYTDKEAPNGGTLIATLGPSGRWSYLANERTGEPTIGTQPENREPMETVLNDHFIPAVRDRDCDEFFKYAVTRLQDPQAACKEEFPLYQGLTDALKADPDARPVWLGGNKRLGFFALQTDKPKPEYRTLVVSKTGPDANQPFLVHPSTLGPEPK